MPPPTIDQMQLYAWLKAAAELGEPMPTNAQIQGRFGTKGQSTPVYALQQLERRGLISIEPVSRYARRVTIIETGQLIQSAVLGTYRGAQQVTRAIERSQAPGANDAPELPVRRSDGMRLNPFMRIPPSSTCRWIDEPLTSRTFLIKARAGDESIYCGERSVLGRSWCPAHFARVSAKRQPKSTAYLLKPEEIDFYRKLRGDGLTDAQARERLQTARESKAR
jgi:hypothetical protein